MKISLGSLDKSYVLLDAARSLKVHTGLNDQGGTGLGLITRMIGTRERANSGTIDKTHDQG